MKLKKVLSLSVGLTLAFSLIACQKVTDSKTTTSAVPVKSIVVGVCAGTYGDMFKDAIAPSLEQKGYKVTIKEFSDYVQPNKALANKVKALSELKEGSLVTIPNDPTNLTRALKVLVAAGFIKIDPKVDIAIATEKDLSENP